MQVCYTGGAAGTYDYRIISADNTVVSLNSTGTTATMVTTAVHGKSPGDPITVAGANQSEYNGTFSVATAPTTTSLTYVMDSDPAVSPATGTSIRFGPVSVNDKVKFYDGAGNASAPANGLVVYIQSVENLIASFN